MQPACSLRSLADYLCLSGHPHTWLLCLKKGSTPRVHVQQLCPVPYEPAWFCRFSDLNLNHGRRAWGRTYFHSARMGFDHDLTEPAFFHRKWRPVFSRLFCHPLYLPVQAFSRMHTMSSASSASLVTRKWRASSLCTSLPRWHTVPIPSLSKEGTRCTESQKRSITGCHGERRHH